MKLSARNRINARVVGVTRGEATANVEMDAGGTRLVASITVEAADELAALAEDAGMTLIELAIAWVINHPAVTAAIIGPRTLEHLESQLPALGHKLDAALLDRIDEIVPPGVNLNSADGGYADPALAPAARRR